jgi:hypothetical protein
MIRKFVGMGFVVLLTFSSCGTSPSNAGSSAPESSAPTDTLKKVDGQIINPQDLPAQGTYEAAGLEMVVTETGATLNTGCTKGTVPTPITLSTDGSFDTTGTMNPLLPQFPVKQTPIALTGKYSDQILNVAVTYGPNGDPQNYNLVLNGEKNLDVACPR